MYKKLFESMYNGSLVTRGPWEALVTFQQMIILADKFGVVDITPEVISRRTGIPLNIITKGIAALEEPDPESRSMELDGRRIDRLADHRPWGWHIVNFTYYDALRRADERAAYQAKKYLERKNKKQEKPNSYEKDSTLSTDINNSTLSTPHSHSHSHSQLHLQHQHKDKKEKKDDGAVTSEKPKRQPATNRLLDHEFLETLSRNPAYLDLDIQKELGKCEAWCTANSIAIPPSKKRFVNWLNRAYGKPGNGHHVSKSDEQFKRMKEQFHRIAGGLKDD